MGIPSDWWVQVPHILKLWSAFHCKNMPLSYMGYYAEFRCSMSKDIIGSLKNQEVLGCALLQLGSVADP